MLVGNRKYMSVNQSTPSPTDVPLSVPMVTVA